MPKVTPTMPPKRDLCQPVPAGSPRAQLNEGANVQNLRLRSLPRKAASASIDMFGDQSGGTNSAPAKALDVPRCDRILGWQMTWMALKKLKHNLPLGLYVLQVHDEAWRELVEESLESAYLLGPHVNLTQAGASDLHRPNAQLLGTRTPIAIGRSSLSMRKSLGAIALLGEDMTNHLAAGVSVCFVTADIDTLPDEVMVLCDQVIQVPPPSRALLVNTVRQVTSPGARLAFGALNYARLTPNMLRLAYRQNTSVSAYIKRLRALLNASAVPPNAMRATKPPQLAEIHGVDEVKAWVYDLKGDLALYRQNQLPWADMPTSALLSGPPGTAKTTLARAIADDCELTFIGTSYADWQSAENGHLGDVIRRMRAVFADARKKAPSLLFIDELDSVGARGSGSGRHDEWWRSVINALLEEMDGRADNTGIVLLAASNHPHLIDPAILRSGRMERHIALPLPNASALTAIYRDQFRNANTEAELDYQQLGQFSAGMSGADVVKICTDARRIARQGKRPLTQRDVLTALSGGADTSTQGDKWRIAVHETGHAIAAILLPSLELDYISVVPRGDRSGGAAFGLREASITSKSLQDYLVAILAGRAAEEVLLGDVSAGSGGARESDLARATQLAADWELTLGLNHERLTWFDVSSSNGVGKLFTQRPDIEQRVNERLKNAYAQAKALLAEHRHSLEHIAQHLLNQQVLRKKEVLACW